MDRWRGTAPAFRGRSKVQFPEDEYFRGIMRKCVARKRAVRYNAVILRKSKSEYDDGELDGLLREMMEVRSAADDHGCKRNETAVHVWGNSPCGAGGLVEPSGVGHGAGVWADHQHAG